MELKHDVCFYKTYEDPLDRRTHPLVCYYSAGILFLILVRVMEISTTVIGAHA